MTANEAINLPYQPLLITNPNNPPDYDKSLPCNPYHLGGGLKSNIGEELLLKIREKIPRVDFNPIIGSTGYIVWPNKLPTESGWTLDEVGRLVGYVNNIRFFQRHVHSCHIVISVDGEPFGSPSSDEITLLNCSLTRKN